MEYLLVIAVLCAVCCLNLMSRVFPKFSLYLYGMWLCCVCDITVGAAAEPPVFRVHLSLISCTALPASIAHLMQLLSLCLCYPFHCSSTFYLPAQGLTIMFLSFSLVIFVNFILIDRWLCVSVCVCVCAYICVCV